MRFNVITSQEQQMMFERRYVVVTGFADFFYYTGRSSSHTSTDIGEAWTTLSRESATRLAASLNDIHQFTGKTFQVESVNRVW